MPFATPNTPTTDMVCWVFELPKSVEVKALFMGALSTLTRVRNWKQVGTMTAVEAASLFSEITVRQKERPCLIGSIIPAVWDTPPSSSYILCDGHTELRSDFPRLYAVLPSALILDSNTFITPDLRGKVLIGAGYNATDDETYTHLSDYGANSGNFTVEQLPAHSHHVDDHTHTSPPHGHSDLGHNHLSNYPLFNIDLEGVGVPDVLGAGNPPVQTPTTIGNANITDSTVSIDAAGAQDTSETGDGEAFSRIQLSLAINYYLIGD